MLYDITEVKGARTSYFEAPGCISSRFPIDIFTISFEISMRWKLCLVHGSSSQPYEQQVCAHYTCSLRLVCNTSEDSSKRVVGVMGATFALAAPCGLELERDIDQHATVKVSGGDVQQRSSTSPRSHSARLHFDSRLCLCSFRTCLCRSIRGTVTVMALVSAWSCQLL